jgi:hypothetical protein
MAIFAIISQPNLNSAKLPGAIARAYKDDHLQLADGSWLAADSGTVKEVSDKLGVTDGSNGAAVIVEVSSYYGRAGNNIWAWVKNKWEASSG